MKRRRPRRRFRCSGCGRLIPRGRAVALVGITVLRKRRGARRQLTGGVGPRWRWEVVEVVATPAYPAHACSACADQFPERRKVAA